jgi:hypothetical protein
VEAYHRQPPARRERLERRRESARELAELIVDEHAQRLKSACRRVLAGLAGAHRRGDQGGELAGGRDRALAPCRDDGLRHAARKALLTVSGDHLAYLVDARPSEPLRDRLAARRVHAHIERAVGSETEAALRVIELR